MRWLYSITDSIDMNKSKLQEIVEEQGGGLQSPGSQRVGYNWVTEQQHFKIAAFFHIHVTVTFFGCLAS